MIGGYQEAELTADLTNLATQHKAAICEKVGIEVVDLTVEKVESQVVAGTNYRFYLAAGDKKLTAIVHQPLPHTNEPSVVSEAFLGHNPPQ